MRLTDSAEVVPDTRSGRDRDPLPEPTERLGRAAAVREPRSGARDLRGARRTLRRRADRRTGPGAPARHARVGDARHA